ncbi:MAG TPA: hypothetical protein VFZ52_24605 [Chryseolinea sp.]
MWTDNSTSDYFAKMNYTFFTGKMVALNENADTLEFKEWREATIINLDGDIFYRDYKEGYMEMILQGPLKDTKGPRLFTLRFKGTKVTSVCLSCFRVFVANFLFPSKIRRD